MKGFVRRLIDCRDYYCNISPEAKWLNSKKWAIENLFFAYRRQITVTEQSGNDLTNYQVLIELNSTNFDFSHANEDGSDIRFYDGSNLLNYWIEKWNSVSQEAKIWVKVPNISANGTISFYMYYGNSNVASASNAENVFEFFENTEHFNAETKFEYGTLASDLTILDDNTIILTYHLESSGEVKVYKSEDYGETWEYVSSPWSSGKYHPRLTSNGSRIYISACDNDSYGNILLKYSDDKGQTWNDLGDTGANGIEGALCYLGNNTLLMSADNDTVIDIYKSTDGGETWSKISTAVNESIHVEDHALVKAPNGDIVLVYQKEWAEKGHCGIYCKYSTDNGETWSDEILIDDDGSSNYDGTGLFVQDNEIYVVYTSNKGRGGSAYENNIVYMKKSSDNGRTWSDSKIVYDTPLIVESTAVPLPDGKFLYSGTRQYPDAKKYVFAVILPMEKLFGDIGLTIDQGCIYCVKDENEKVFAVEGWRNAQKRAFVKINVESSNYVIDFYIKGETGNFRIAFRYNDVNNHYLWNPDGSYSAFWKRVNGAYSKIEETARNTSGGIWYKCEIICLENNFKVYMNDNLLHNLTDSTFPNGDVALSNHYNFNTDPIVYYKNLKIRKYVEPEPSVSIGSEETP